MPTTTMVTETDTKLNRRRPKAPAGIYRPPPARRQQSDDYPRHNQNYKGDVFQKKQYLDTLKEYQINLYNDSDKHSNYENFSNKELIEDSKELDSKQRARRPDQQFYVPKKRSPHDKTIVSQIFDECSSDRPPSPTNSICSVASEFSGRNRYVKRQNIMSLLESDEKLSRKPPFYSYPNSENDKLRAKPSLFASETLQLIERCINKDINNTGTHNKASVNSKCFSGESNERPKHPVHSKENLHHSETSKRSRKSRSNRKGQSISRDSSTESRSSVNCQRPFFNSHNVKDYERCSYSYENLNIRCNNQSNSRNPSLERPRTDSPSSGYGWRVRESPKFNGSCKISPNYIDLRSQRRQSGKVLNNSEELKFTGKLNHSNENYLHISGCTVSENQNNCSKEISTVLDNRLLQQELDSSCKDRRDQESDAYNNVSLVIENSSGTKEVHLRESTLNRDQKYTEELCKGDETHLSSQIRNINLEVSQFTASSENVINNANFLTPPTPCNPLKISCTTEIGIYNYRDIASSGFDSNNSLYSSPPSTPSHATNYSPKFLTPPITPSENEHHYLQSDHHCIEDTDINCVNTLLKMIDDNSVCEDDHIDKIDGTFEELLLKLQETEISTSKSDDICDNTYIDSLCLNDSLANSDSDQPTEDMSDYQNPELIEESNPKKFSFCWADEVAEGKEDSWDSLYDDSGNCLDYSIKQQLFDTVGKVQLEKPSNEYSEFKPEEPQINDDDYGHVVEIYDFPASFKTQDLMVIFQQFKSFDLRWVDDTHALGIFATTLQAADALALQHPFVKTRPLIMAIPASKTKALRLSDANLPYKPRPATSVALARRLVSGALGLKVSISREQRDAEKNKLKNAKEQKRLIARQKEEAWEGTLGNIC